MYYENFEKLCKKNNVKPGKVSRETGIPTSTLTYWKIGRSTPKTDKLQLIADYFNVPLSALTAEKEERTFIALENPNNPSLIKLIELAKDLPDEDINWLIAKIEKLK